jgi:hypothetical protein
MKSHLSTLRSAKSAKVSPLPVTPNLKKVLKERVQKIEMDHRTFAERWECTYADIADVCDVSVRTVERWFSAKSPFLPDENARFKMGMADQIWRHTRLTA